MSQAVLETFEEHEAADQYINDKGYQYQYVWFGLEDLVVEGEYVWEHTGELATYEVFGSDTFSNTTNCVRMYYDYWWETNCNDVNYRLCESDPIA